MMKCKYQNIKYRNAESRRETMEEHREIQNSVVLLFTPRLSVALLFVYISNAGSGKIS